MAASNPAESGFDPRTFGSLADPYAALADLRSEHPVRRVAGGFWAVTSYDAAMEVLRHPECGSSPIALRYLEGLPAGPARDEMVHRINFLDPPDHPRVRSLVSSAFTPKRIATLRSWLESTARELITGLDVTQPHDLIDVFTHQLPSLAISELLGIPAADRTRLTAWSDDVAPLLSVEVTAQARDLALAAAQEFHNYLELLIGARRAQPGEDLLSALVLAETDGDRLSPVELRSLAATLYSAGHRTTRDLVTNGMSVMLSDPQRWEAVVAGTWTVSDVVTEFLRFETPTMYVARVTLADLTISDVSIGSWQPILVFLGAANRDPAVHDSPDEFRPGRDGPAALSFAFGAHYCLGASLARVEAEVMVAALRETWPKMTLDPSVPLAWHQRGPFRGLDRLVVKPT